MSEPEYMVCPSCRGRGTSSAYLGAFDSERWNEMGEQWQEAYIEGLFDKPCPECQGLRVVTQERMDEYADEVQDEHIRRMESGERW